MSLLADVAAALTRVHAYALAEERVRSGEDITLAAPGIVRPLLAAALFRAAPAPTLLVIAGEAAAERFARQMTVYLPHERVLRYPMRAALPWARDAHDVEAVGLRARAIHALEKGQPAVVVASARSLLRTLPPFGSQTSEPLRLEEGRRLDLEEAVERLSRMGYERLGRSEDRGQFAVRGGTLDVFGADSPFPVRAELFGDEIETLRRYVPSSGQSIGDSGPTDVFPCREVRLSVRAVRSARSALADAARTDGVLARDLELMGEHVYFNGVERYLPVFYPRPGHVTDHLSPDAAVVVLEPRSIFDDAARRHDELEGLAKSAGRSLDGLFITPSEVDLGSRRRVTLLSLLRAGGSVDGEIIARRPEVAGGEGRLVDGLRALVDGGDRVLFAARDAGMREKLSSLLVEEGVGVSSYDIDRPADPGSPQDVPAGLDRGVVNVAVADVPTGFVIPRAALALVSADDAFPRAERTTVSRTESSSADISFDYVPGDHVVHTTHGIAHFANVVRKVVLGVERDYLLLEYAGGDRLYVPLEQIGRVGKYVGSDASAPRLTRLNTADWSRVVKRTRKAVKQLAFDLVDLYARRATVRGFPFGSDTPWQAEMEAAFPFEETPDQTTAIAAVKADMESHRPMDRLVAGDVGYGKTEVAIRAAFKAVQSGKQVMVLCPTTVLAQQHLTTFSERFEPFAIEVEVLSRFRTKKQQRETLDGFAQGTVDVLVGTHRLLSADVVPKDLGLVVIDEEQRFGVGHKEHFKHLREQIDVLTLSATPIPRTLRMALSGVRDLTVIDTPPSDRFPVGVHVGEYDHDLVQAAIRAELERGGQVYYVYNRVKDIEGAVARVREAVPEARIGVGHGQMSERELERVMESFSAGEHDVLVSTTIVESGLDNPHTNTLVIEDSQRLGLAQLYQLKGRVGRSHVQAHAYFFFPRGSALTDEAHDRLSAVREHAGLGSGIKIAMRDLEIRGAGSLLGAEQHGNVSAVGFELFSQMLREAVAEARGEAEIAYPEVRVDLGAPAFLPEEYVPRVDERVRYYRRLAAARTPEALEKEIAAVEETHGALPVPACNMVGIARVRLAAVSIGAGSVIVDKGRLIVQPISLSVSQRGRLSARLGTVYHEKGHRLFIPLADVPDVVRRALEIMRTLVEESADE